MNNEKLLGGYTPLMMAVDKGDLKLIRSLIPNSNINELNDVMNIQKGDSALTLAVKHGNLEIIKELAVFSSVDLCNNVN